MEITGATTLSMVTYMIPIVATILGVVVLHEQLGWHVYIACALIITGVMAVNGVFHSISWRRLAEAAA
jgi:drug/metabolite transporter (DMT)-like permease